MKAILTILGVIIFSSTLIPAAAQTAKFNPVLKVGTVLECEVYANGQTMPITMKISVLGSDDITLDYDFQGTATGKFINSKANLEKGTQLNWDEPVPGEERKLSDNQTIAMVSRIFLKELKENKKAKYDGKDLLLKEIPKGKEIILDGKEVDAIYAESENGYSRYWILNNDKFPILLKIEGTDVGVDLSLKSIH